MAAAVAAPADALPPRPLSPPGDGGPPALSPASEATSAAGEVSYGGLTTSSFDVGPSQIENPAQRNAAGLATLREARERFLSGEDLKVKLKAALGDVVRKFDLDIPRMEELLLQRLRVVGRVAAYDDREETSYEWVKETREACEKVEMDLQYLIDRRAKTKEFLKQVEDVDTKGDVKGCSELAHDAYRQIIAELRREGGFRDTLWDSPYIGRVLSPSEVYEEKLFTERNRSVNITFNSGMSAICIDETMEGQDTTCLYLGFENGTVVSYNLIETNVENQYQGHLYPVLFLKVIRIRDVSCIVSSSKDKCVKISEVKSKKVRYCLTEHAGLVTDLHFSDGVLYTASLDGTVSWWHNKGYREGNIITGKGICKTLFLEGEVGASRHIVAGDRDGAIRVYRLKSSRDALRRDPKGKTVGFGCKEMVAWPAHRGRVSSMLYANDFLVTGGEDSRIYVWDSVGLRGGAQGKLVHLLSYHIDTVLDLVVSEKGVLFSAGADAVIVMWDLRTGHIVQILSDHFHHVTGLTMVKLSSKTLEKLETSTTKLSELLSLDSLFANEAYIENSCLKGRNKKRKQTGEKKTVTWGELPKKDSEVRRDKKKRYVKEKIAAKQATSPLRSPHTGDAIGGGDGSRDDMVSSWEVSDEKKDDDAIAGGGDDAENAENLAKRFVLLSTSLDKSLCLWTLHEYSKHLEDGE